MPSIPALKLAEITKADAAAEVEEATGAGADVAAAAAVEAASGDDLFANDDDLSTLVDGNRACEILDSCATLLFLLSAHNGSSTPGSSFFFILVAAFLAYGFRNTAIFLQ
jgi:hypothetical protein